MSGDLQAQRARLSRLFERLAALLPSLPGFISLSAFGSLPEGRADAYSDLDLAVVTHDLPAARAQLLGLLEGIGPVEFCWVISVRPGEWNPTIAFSEESYYHKLDLGLAAVEATDRAIPAAQTVLVTDAPRPLRPGALRQSLAYQPPMESVGHFLLGQLLGATRYVKSRKRGKPATCYRFAAAAANGCLRAVYARVTQEYAFSGALSTDEYGRLDALLPGGQAGALFEALDFSSPAAMDRAMLSVLTRLTAECRAAAEAIGEPFPQPTFDRMVAFVQEELAVTG